MLVITEIVIVVIALILVFFIFKLLKKLFRFRVSVKQYDEMAKQVRNLQRDLMRANFEKDKLLQMRIAELGGGAGDFDLGSEDGENTDGEEVAEESAEEYIPDANRNTITGPCIDPADSRFYRLTYVDNYYKTEYQAPEYDSSITLESFCEQFRLYAASQLGLYYDIDMMRYFIASMGTARIIILQGISGTGKTSLPYAFGKFVQ